MSKYLRTLFAALLVVSLAVTGAMATEDFPKIARELIWVSGAATVTANPDTGNLVIRDSDGHIVEYPGNYDEESDSDIRIIDPYNDNSTLGEILNNVFFVNGVTNDTFGMRRLGTYAFKFRGEGLPQAFISYNEDSHRYWIPQKLYDVEWTMETSDAEFKISYDIDVDEGTIVISGLEYPNPVTSKDYKITLVGTPYLTSVGEKYYTFDYLEDAMANFPLKWSMTIHVYNDGRVVLAPGSGDIYGQNIFNKLVKPASGVNINEVSMNDSNYRVTILNDQTQDFTIAGGTVRHTYRLSLYPQDNVDYTYMSALTTQEDPDSEPYYIIYEGTYYANPDDMPSTDVIDETVTALVPLYDNSEDFSGDPLYTLPVSVTMTEEGVDYAVKDPATGEALDFTIASDDIDNPTYFSFTPASTYYAYGDELDFDPSKIAYDSENGEYVYSDDNVVSSSFDIDVYEKYVDEDNPNYTGSNIRGFAVRYNPKGELNEEDEEDEFVYYPVFMSNPYIYDGVYIPEGLVLVANYGAELYAGPDGAYSGDVDTPNLPAGRIINRSPLLGKRELRNYYDVVEFLGYLDTINGGGYEDADAFADALADTPVLANYVSSSLDVLEQMDGDQFRGGLYVGNYLLSYDKSVAESAIRGVKAGKVMRFTLPLVSVINDAFDDVVRTPLGRTLASGYKLQWNVLFSGDVEEEEEPVTPVIGVSGDLSATVAVGEGHDFVLSYDATLFSYTISPDADYIEEGTDEDGNEIITITPPSAGTFTATLTPYETESPDNKGTAITLTVTANLPGQLAATFNPATVPVKAGETATSMLEIVNATTGSPAVAGVSPSADWVTYEPRFINGGAFYEFKFAPAATMTAGTHTFTVTVSDDDKTTSAVVTVNVTAAGGDDPTPSAPAAPTATDLSTFQAALTDNTATSASVVVVAPSSVTVSSWKVYDNGAEVTDTNKVSIQNNLPNQSARVTVYPDAFDAGDHTLTARYVTTDSTTSNALTLGSFTVADVPVVPVVGKNGGGGCDAGFGALALAAVSLFLLKKRS